MATQLKCKHGIFKNFEINANSHISYVGNHDYEPPRRITGRKKKYEQVQLIHYGRLKWFYTHRLMAYSWLGKPPHVLRCIVDHKNGNSLENVITNLRWVTQTANQINKVCFGIVFENGFYYPKVAGFVHERYKSVDLELVKIMRQNLVECYVRYNSRWPNNGSDFPHKSIHLY